MESRQQKMKHFWGDRSIQTKLLISMISLVFCSVFILGIYFYQVSANLIVNNEKNYIENTMNQIGKNLDYNIKAVEDILFELSTSDAIQKDIKLLNQQGLKEYEKIKIEIEIKNLMIKEITKLNAVEGVFLYTQEGSCYSARQRYYQTPPLPIEEIDKKKGGNLWMQPDEELDIVPVGKAICSLDNQKVIGHYILYVKEDYFTSVFEDISYKEENAVFIYDSGNESYLGTEKQAGDIAEMSKNYQSGTVMNIYTGDEEKQFCAVVLDRVPWLAVSYLSPQSQNRKLVHLRIATIGVMLLVLVLITFLVVVISRGISRPIKKLAISMEQFSKGDFGIQTSVLYQDEIGKLRESFNKMVQDINKLITDIFEEKNLKQQAQLHALQMQINPHFLYNTLDTINWLAISQGADNVGEVTRSLGALMRFSLKEQELISLEEELEAVENYICIQKYRYGDELHIKLQVEEAALYEQVPRHILLPIIENAIEHGLSDRKGEKRIIVAGNIMEDAFLVLTVKDNGVGMTEDILHRIQINLSQIGEQYTSRRRAEGHMEIGIENVHRRIQLHFGAEYGLNIESIRNKGTTVSIRIPLQSFADEDDSAEYIELEEKTDEI